MGDVLTRAERLDIATSAEIGFYVDRDELSGHSSILLSFKKIVRLFSTIMMDSDATCSILTQGNLIVPPIKIDWLGVSLLEPIHQVGSVFW